MNTLNECPCCSEQLLRHARHGRVYWFCRHCRQEMPNLVSVIAANNHDQKAANSKKNLSDLMNLV